MSFYGQCWVQTSSGWYGVSMVSGLRVSTHRAAYEALVGPIPAGLVLDHLCRNPGCYNPTHLEPAINAENIRRGLALRTACPHGHPYDAGNTYLTPAGHRRCRSCHRQRQNARYHARQAIRL